MFVCFKKDFDQRRRTSITSSSFSSIIIEPILLFSFYKNIQRQLVIYEGFPDEEKYEQFKFNIQAFEEELKVSQQVTEHIIIGGDWDAQNPLGWTIMNIVSDAMRAYQIWKKHKLINNSNYITWTVKLSTLSRSCIHAGELYILEALHDSQRHVASPLMKVTIFTHSENHHLQKLEYPIQGITTNYGSEAKAIKQSLEYVYKNYKEHQYRVIILCDYKFVANSLMNKWNHEEYKFQIGDYQRILKAFNNKNVTEIYWIKGHSEIPGNEHADIVAKRARRTAD
ncbi:ribonuclease HI [Reticulomyxa filosa]|uniref:Ribonuclease HI n=1 Tax=Reticulomyxa filosa TaxID=46433 RepID=X6MR54_RETFI|nr:ribonuclease HI [Reticulomyxa filosa]|eukprot:ETO15585.1 ribonuclease HI [Reticulomyxa filosa]